jgi:hypothetical protein
MQGNGLAKSKAFISNILNHWGRGLGLKILKKNPKKKTIELCAMIPGILASPLEG